MNVIFSCMDYQATAAFALKLDKQDPLKQWRKEFLFPAGRNTIYFAGNSLGLQLKTTRKAIERELDDWARLGVNGHIKSHLPWMHYYRHSKKTLAALTGSKATEVIAMNHLTLNLHLLMISFYRPREKRFRIITEAGAFSSDQYAVECQVRLHGFDPSEAIVEVFPRKGEFTLRTSDIIKTIETVGDETALVLFGGIQYYTGQLFDIPAITRAAHAVGAIAGFDLAHAIGNVPLQLNKDKVDFAVWCSYKYLNSGPGGMGGAFIHESHFDKSLPRLAGWWGYFEPTRFEMTKGFIPMPGIDGWQVSNYDVISGAAMLAALSPFQATGITSLRKKSILLTGYLAFLLNGIDPDERYYQIITPKGEKERGCQLSIFMKTSGKRVFNTISRQGVVADWREPNVIRVAPVPMYNTFSEVFRFARIFQRALSA